MTALSVLGRMCTAISRLLLAPTQRAASTNSFCLIDIDPGPNQAGDVHPVQRADDPYDEQENAGFRSQYFLQRIAEQVGDHQQQRQHRQSQEQVGQTHEQAVDAAAEEARDRSDERAEGDGDDDGDDADGHRHAPAEQRSSEQVAPQVVGTKRDAATDGPSRPAL